jgi:hypothetical protein
MTARPAQPHAKRPPGAFLREALTAMRPAQWTKNLVVLAALAFAWGERARPAHVATVGAVQSALLAVAVFCLISSAVYIFNDLCDIEADRRHPRKKERPIAAGRLSTRQARVLAGALLLAGGLIARWLLPPSFLLLAGAYVAMQAAYSAFLKRIPLVDMVVIASGFVMRAMAGAFAVQLRISPWLLVCTFLLALFLAVCKRRCEKAALGNGAADQRPALEQCSLPLLDQLVATSAGATITGYAMYTLASETIEKFGTHAMAFTIPFVVFGIFRYMNLLYRHDQCEQPERILLGDPPLIGSILLYGATILLIFASHAS